MLNASEHLHRIALLLDEAAQRLDAITARDPAMADLVNAIPHQDEIETIARRLRDLAHDRQRVAPFAQAAE